MTPRRRSNHNINITQNPRKHKPDYLILIFSALLLGLGIILLVAISPALTAQGNLPGSYYVFRQLVALSLGIILFLFFSRMPEGFFKKTQKIFIGVSIISVLAVLIISGVAFRWVQIGGFSFQPAELIKFTIITSAGLFLADRVRSGENHDTKKTLLPLALWMSAVGFAIVILERDLGSMVVMLSIIFTMLFVANASFKKLLIAGLVIVGLIFASITSTPYRRDRVMTYLQPERDCTTTGYHACQALIAVGSGGLIGLGLGNSVQAYGYLPEASNDSIFAVYAEKFGFIGSTLLLLLYGSLMYRILMVVIRSEEIFNKLVSSGVFAWFLIQAFINIGAMVGLLPLKGITLPFISYGGTSLVFVLAGLGLVYRASGFTLIRRSVRQ